MNRLVARISIVLGAIGFLGAPAGAQDSTTFTYQGELLQGGAPANGVFSVRCSLWSAQSGGVQIGSDILINNVSVSDGRLRVEVDFGAPAFNNAERWLQIAVNGVTLTPRQAITRAPYAIQTRGIFVDANLNVGIGTLSPQANLHIDGAGSAEVGLHVQSPGASTGMIRFGSPRSNLGISGNANNGLRRDIWFMDEGLGLFTRASTESPFAGNGLFINDSGNVGIGTTSPGSRLDVAGDGRFRNRVGVGNPTSLFGQLTIRDSGDAAPFAIEAQWGNNSFPAIYASNTGSGGVLWALGTSDVSLSGGGMIVIGGPSSGINMALDNNEIMVRNDGNPSPLFLNAEGGDVKMGVHRIHPAYAYAQIRSNATIASRSTNVTNVTTTSTGFIVTITGGVNPSDIIIATDASADSPHVISADSSGGQLRIRCYSPVTSNWGPHDVHVVIFRP